MSPIFFVPQVARAGRFGTKGLAVTFVSDEADAKTLNDVQDRFEVNVAELPEEIDISSYSKLYSHSQALLPVSVHVHWYNVFYVDVFIVNMVKALSLTAVVFCYW